MGKNGIVLIGMAGVGKSTIGRALAEALKYDFIDLDVYLTERAGKTLQQIIDEQGEVALLDLERQRLLEIDLDRKVVSPGGSIIYDADLMTRLKGASCLVFLDDTFINIAKRLRNAPSRGIVGLKTKSLKEIYDERQPIYTKFADIIVRIQGKRKEEIISEIVSRLATYICL